MTININSRIGQHKNKKYLTFLATSGSCMAHLNCLPSRAAGVNYWFFLLAHVVVGVGIKQNARCCYARLTAKWMCKIEDFPWNCEMKTVATCSTTDGNASYHELAPSFFEEMTCCRHQKHCRRRPENPNGPSKFRKYRVHLPL